MLLYLVHLAFELVAAVGGYWARGFCPHRRHRVALGVSWSAVTTAALVHFVG